MTKQEKAIIQAVYDELCLAMLQMAMYETEPFDDMIKLVTPCAEKLNRLITIGEIE